MLESQLKRIAWKLNHTLGNKFTNTPIHIFYYLEYFTKKYVMYTCIYKVLKLLIKIDNTILLHFLECCIYLYHNITTATCITLTIQLERIAWKCNHTLGNEFTNIYLDIPLLTWMCHPKMD